MVIHSLEALCQNHRDSWISRKWKLWHDELRIALREGVLFAQLNWSMDSTLIWSCGCCWP